MEKHPLENLMEEHRSALANLDALEEAIPALGSKAEAMATVEEVVRFLDRELELHLRKEEEALFPQLERQIGAGGGPTYVMRLEHRDLRQKKGQLAELLPQAKEGDVASLGQMASTAHYIIIHLREHIWKEDNILFPMSQEHLEESAWPEIARRFEEIEKGVGAEVIEVA